MERQMTEAVTITNEELAILCDIVAGWSVKKAESLDRGRQQALDRLIANGFRCNACCITALPGCRACPTPNSTSTTPISTTT